MIPEFQRPTTKSTLALACCVFAIAVARDARAQAPHEDILVQQIDGKLAVGTGFPDANNGVMGSPVFARFFPVDYVASDPGLNSIGGSSGTPPAGTSPLPGNTDLSWDFLPMKVGGIASNLLYWNVPATPSPVAFGLPPAATYSLALFGRNFQSAAADGTDKLVTGPVLERTQDDGRIHTHLRVFFLDNDLDGGNATAAVPGVYLAAMRMRMDALDRSDPLYVMFHTPGMTAPAQAALEAARAWVDARVELLAPNFDADFDGDLDVDGADFLTWQRNVGKATGALQIEGDANGDHAVTAADLAELKAEFGLSVATSAGVPTSVATSPIPEPGSLTLMLGLAAAGWRRAR